MTTSPLLFASNNAAAFWAALAEARGYHLVRRPGFLAIHGTERYGLRIMVLRPDLSPQDLAELQESVRRHGAAPITVEDPFSTVEVDGLIPRRLPVMIRPPSPAPLPAASVELVATKEDLAVAEQVVVDGFTLESFQPYRPGEVFPGSLLDNEGVDIFLVNRNGEPAGASVAVVDDSCGEPVVGVYWVTTMPRHRSHGIGRALMLAALARFAELPMTLTASRAGKPLYDSMGFTVIVESTWWSR